jgi:hypothetical protein
MYQMTTVRLENQAFAYWIDEHDQIVCVSDNWSSFASANDAPGLMPEAVLQRPIWEFLADDETYEFYQILLERVRSHNLSARLPFRCDSPEAVRFMEMRISPTSDGLIQFDTRLLEELIREPVTLLDASIARSDEQVALCSWCKKVEVAPARWQEAEQAMETLNLFEVVPLPGLKHALCGDCREALERELAQLSRRKTRILTPQFA